MSEDTDQPNDQARYFNRDLSWLEFNRRVLVQALDARTPLLERVKFLAIFGSNTDEFFMKRVGLLKRRQAQGKLSSPSRPGELPPGQTLTLSREQILDDLARQADVWEHDIRPALRDAGVEMLAYDELGGGDRRVVDDWFRANVFPVLTPLAVDPGHKFPFISNLSENLGVLLKSAGGGSAKHVFARVKVPAMIDPFVRIDALDTNGGGGPAPGAPARFAALTDIIAHNLDELFPGLKIVEVLPFRVTRSAAIEPDDEDADDLLEQVEAELRARRFADALRIQVGPEPSRRVLSYLVGELGLSEQDVYERPGPLGFADLFQIADLDRPDLKDPVWTPVAPAALSNPDTDIFSVIRRGDVLVHHPYESFELSVERFVAEAARDPDVLAIKQTLYRTSRDSPFIESLIAAAEEGKQVACLVELRARFDEEKNVHFARQLESAGVHVAYGVLGYKTHCKCSLVVRREHIDGRPGICTYAHIGTGNYHPGTAQLYTDLGILTADAELTGDVLKLFNALTGHAEQHDYARLVVAPGEMRTAFNKMIDKEIKNASKGKPARIVAKMNQLEDRQITDRLYEASQAGVKIDLIIRGFCCLRPGVEGLSENITVRSIIGRLLEHSRVFHFANGKEDPADGKFYIGSGDWMFRNLNNRVEAMAPVRDADARREIWDVLSAMFRDRRRAWTVNADGTHSQLMPREKDAPDSPEALGTFEWMMRRYRKG